MRLLHRTRGSTTIVFCALAPLFVAGAGYSTELVYWELRGRHLQHAVDIAAYAAGTQKRSGRPDLVSAPTDIFASGGYDLSRLELTVDSPPRTGEFADDPQALQLTARYTLMRSFSALFAMDDHITVARRATARIYDGRPACILALDPETSGALSFSGSTDVTITGCDVATNSLSVAAIDVDGSANVTADCASAAGGISNDGGMTYTDCASPIESAPLAIDRFLSLPDPDLPPDCTDKSALTTHGAGAPAAGRKYCGGGIINGDIALQPGTYFLSSGTWKINSQARVAGEGVMIYLTGGATLEVAGGAALDLVAPADGPYAGIVIFTDRRDTSHHKLNGGSGLSLVGTVYMPAATLDFGGNDDAAATCMQLIAWRINISGNSAFNNDCSGYSGVDLQRSAPRIVLVE